MLENKISAISYRKNPPKTYNWTNKIKVDFRKNKGKYLLLSVVILFYLIFYYKPLYGALIAFQDYMPNKGITGSKWVGFEHFKTFFGSMHFWRLIINTFSLSIMDMIVGFPAPIILALLLNEVHSSRIRKVSQTLIYIPHFMSWPVIASLTFFLLSTDVGVINKLLLSLGRDPLVIITSPKAFWWMLLGQNIWKDIGWGTIIYLAAISQIDQGMYEAATIDGATRFQQIIRITLPCIVPTFIVLFLMRLGRLLNISFEQVWLMQNNLVYSVSEIFDTYSFRVGLSQGNYGVATAVGMLKSIVGLFLVLTSNWLIKKSGNDGIF